MDFCRFIHLSTKEEEYPLFNLRDKKPKNETGF